MRTHAPYIRPTSRQKTSLTLFQGHSMSRTWASRVRKMTAPLIPGAISATPLRPAYNLAAGLRHSAQSEASSLNTLLDVGCS